MKAKKQKYISSQKRKSGNAYLVKIPYLDADGIRRYYEKTFSEAKYGESAKAYAIYHRNEKIAEFQAGDLPQSAPTVSALYKRKDVLFPCRASTKKKHRYFYNQAISKYGNVPIDQIKTSDVQISLNEYAKTHTSAMTAKLLALWRQIFRAAQMDGVRVTDKTLGVLVPKDSAPVQKRSQTITDAEFRMFMDELKEYHAYDEIGQKTSLTVWRVLMVMYYTGIRPAEAFALRKASCDLVNRQISIDCAVGTDSIERKKIVPVKTANALRTVPISRDLMPILRDAIEEADDYLFLIRGELIDIDYFSNYIHLVSKKCGIEFRSYMLRHKFATDLQKTETPRTVQDLLGHASFAMSVEYARSSEEERQEAIDKRFN